MALFRRKRDLDQVGPDDRSPETGLKYKDLLVLGQLIQAGADLTQPRHVLHYLYFPDEAQAEAASLEAAGRGFTAEVREPLAEHPGQWSVVCEQHGVVLDPPKVGEDGDFFDELAVRHGGEYDGWEASV